MSKRMRYIAQIVLLLALSIAASADIPSPGQANRNRPRPPADLTTRMAIRPDTEAKEAKLIIPRDVWQQMRAGLDGDDNQTAATASASLSNLGPTQTVMAGIFLSLAFAFGGVWLVRSRKTSASRLTNAALGIAAVALCSATATVVFANAGPPPVARSLTSKVLLPELQWWGAHGQVKIELAEPGDEITLVLPKAKDETR